MSGVQFFEFALQRAVLLAGWDVEKARDLTVGHARRTGFGVEHVSNDLFLYIHEFFERRIFLFSRGPGLFHFREGFAIGFRSSPE